MGQLTRRCHATAQGQSSPIITNAPVPCGSSSTASVIMVSSSPAAIASTVAMTQSEAFPSGVAIVRAVRQATSLCPQLIKHRNDRIACQFKHCGNPGYLGKSNAIGQHHVNWWRLPVWQDVRQPLRRQIRLDHELRYHRDTFAMAGKDKKHLEVHDRNLCIGVKHEPTMSIIHFLQVPLYSRRPSGQRQQGQVTVLLACPFAVQSLSLQATNVTPGMPTLLPALTR